MKHITCLLLISLLLFNSSCEKDDGIYNLTGTAVFDNGLPAAQAAVFLDEVSKTTTDNKGYFSIKDIPAGNYSLKVTASDSASGYTVLESDVDLKNGDLNMDLLLLPVPVVLYEATHVTSKSLSLSWNRSHADDFREYKIYIHDKSALDESTGTLLHIATNPNDTVYSVEAGDFWWGGSTLSPNTTYYFRIYVMNGYGRHGGSNIQEVTTGLWDNSDTFTHSYSLELDYSFAAQGDLTGIAWDGSYFWMLYYKEQGGFYDNNKVTLVQYDLENGTTLQEYIFDDSNFSSAGMTWDGTQAWISLYSNIRSVDMETGAWDKIYQIGDGIMDLAWTGNELVVLDGMTKASLMNPKNGIISSHFITPFSNIGYSGDRGVAYRAGEIWVINTRHNEICILDEKGTHMGVAEVDFLGTGLYAIGYNHLRMCFKGDQLVIAADSHVKVYNLTPID